MTERKQPVCKGTNEKGELVWGFIPMPYWQMAMFPLKYYGDFMAHWIKLKFFEHTGYESERDIPSCQFKVWQTTNEWKKKNRKERLNTGD